MRSCPYESSGDGASLAPIKTSVRPNDTLVMSLANFIVFWYVIKQPWPLASYTIGKIRFAGLQKNFLRTIRFAQIQKVILGKIKSAGLQKVIVKSSLLELESGFPCKMN